MIPADPQTGREPLFRSHVTVLIEAPTMLAADRLLSDWLDHAENVSATWTTTEVPEDER